LTSCSLPGRRCAKLCSIHPSPGDIERCQRQLQLEATTDSALSYGAKKRKSSYNESQCRFAVPRIREMASSRHICVLPPVTAHGYRCSATKPGVPITIAVVQHKSSLCAFSAAWPPLPICETATQDHYQTLPTQQDVRQGTIN
jgi:hypothetical protein